MDTLTHALAGAVISDGWFRRRLGPFATPFALAAAALPDIDILILRLLSPDNPWLDHRGYTHSLFITLPAAPLLGLAAARLAGKPGEWRAWALLALLCLYSHILLDVVTSWGTMLFLPFSNQRAALDAAPILDIFVFSLSLASFAANRLLRREKTETFINPLAYPAVHRHPGRVKLAGRLARPAGGLILCYLLIGWLQSRQTAEIARLELAAAGITAVETRAMPLLFTHLAWGVAARDAEGNVHNAVYSSFAPRPLRFVVQPAGNGPEAAAALASPAGKRFAWFTQGMFTAKTGEVLPGDAPPPGAHSRVEIRDCRFFSLAPPWRPLAGIDVFLDSGLRILSVRERRASWAEMDLWGELARLRRLTIGGESGE
jgi:membrane-bound metal-dependent hydrolase YbcI (DUF457 family)